MKRMRAAGLAGLLLTAGAAAALVLATAGAASAHDFLVSTDPPADSTVTEPLSTVSLVFNEPPLAELGAGIAIEVRDAGGTNVASGDVSIVDSTLSIAVAPSTQGAYTVLWQTVSADGHTVSGQYAFTYAGPVESAPTTPAGTPTPSATPDDATAAATAAPASPATPTTAASDQDAAAAGAPSAAVLLGIGAAVVVVIAVVILAVVLNRRRSAPPGGPRG